MTRRHPSIRGHDEKSRTSTSWASRRFHTSCASPVDPEHQEVRARRAHLDARGSRQAPRTAGPVLRRAWRRGVPSPAAKSSAIVPASWVGTDRLYGSSTLSSSAIIHVGRDREAEPDAGERPHLRVRAHDGERQVFGDELQRAPLRELAVGLVDHEHRADLGRGGRQALDGFRRLHGAGRVVRAADEHHRRPGARR